MKVLINQETKLHSGNRKRVYLFVIDEEKANHKRIVTEKEIALMNLQPDFITDGQLRHCAKENILFWLKNQTLSLGNLMAIWFFFNPDSITNVKTSLADINSHVEKIEKANIPTMH